MNGVGVAPFGPTLCQNVAPRLRIIFQALLGLKAQPGPGPARAWPGPKSGLSRPSKTIKIGLNGIEVAPFGPKLCQNVPPRLRIIFQALLGPKTQFKK